MMCDTACCIGPQLETVVDVERQRIEAAVVAHWSDMLPGRRIVVVGDLVHIGPVAA